ncbi:hypothetical protein ACFLUY_01190 [Chloroflexota bacterium]
MVLQRLFGFKKSRKYPIIRDDNGQSLRKQCFEQFEELRRPVEVARELGMKESTAIRYFHDWKRLGPNFERRYSYVQGLLKKTSPDRDRSLELFARAWGIQIEELETILIQPNGLRRLMIGKFYLPGHAVADHKLHVALEVALCISDHLIKDGGKFADVRYAFERLMKESMEYRKGEDADIKEGNQEIAFTRQVLEAADKEEQEGRPKRDKLTNEEINDIFKYGLEAKAEFKIRNIEKQYWFRITDLMDEGLTQAQAREKVYQDLLDKGDLEGAKMMRQYQDKIHPMKSGDQDPPASPSKQPPKA